MIFVTAMDGQTYRAYQTFILAISINANKSGILFMTVTSVRLNELVKRFGKSIDFSVI